MSDSEAQLSVTEWIANLKQGDHQAALQLWNRYFDRLVALARNKLGTNPRRVFDEEDVALSVFDTLCRGANEGRFDQLQNRDDLWKLLAVITTQKAIDHLRCEGRQKRGGGQVRGDSIFVTRASVGEEVQGFDVFVGNEPTSEFIALLDEQNTRLMNLLRDDTLRSVAVWRMLGHTNTEIADFLHVVPRTVERKLELIRRKWESELADQNG